MHLCVFKFFAIILGFNNTVKYKKIINLKTHKCLINSQESHNEWRKLTNKHFTICTAISDRSKLSFLPSILSYHRKFHETHTSTNIMIPTYKKTHRRDFIKVLLKLIFREAKRQTQIKFNFRTETSKQDLINVFKKSFPHG